VTRVAAAQGAPRSVADIARLMHLARQSVQRIADLLVGDGPACHEDNPAHARAKHLCLSASGRHTLARIQDAQRQWANGVAAGLDPDQLRAGSDLLAQVTLLLQSGVNEA
jgi:DNA-binding MarR family transcriptional regulator